jgi:hypothetical protein
MFEYVMVLASIIIGLAMTHILQGVARLVQHPRRAPLYWVHLCWVLYMFLTAVFWWWWEFRFQSIQEWTLQLYLFVLGYAFLIYLVCALLFPADLEGYDGFKDYFYSRRAWFFGLQAAWLAVDLGDTLLKGTAYFTSFGLEYPVATIVQIVLCIAAAITRNERFHGAFVVAMLLYQAYWSLRYFDTLT